MVNLTNMQTAIHKWSLHNFGDQPSWRCLLGAVEEIGELCHVYLKCEQNIRIGAPVEKDSTVFFAEIKAKKADAVADIIIYLMDYCARESIDLDYTLASTWWEVSQRDWKRFPKNGKTE